MLAGLGVKVELRLRFGKGMVRGIMLLRFCTRVALAASVTLTSGWAQQYLVSTVAGGAPVQTPIPALQASIAIGIQDSVAVDNKANVYFTSGVRVLYKLDSTGTLTRVAGTGSPVTAADPPDGALATSGQMIMFGLAVDSAGNLFLTDPYRIRKVTPDGVITTFAGNGRGGVYSGDGGPAINAGFTYPTALDFDAAGNLTWRTHTGSVRSRQMGRSRL